MHAPVGQDYCLRKIFKRLVQGQCFPGEITCSLDMRIRVCGVREN